jgi:hypothetical protein
MKEIRTDDYGDDDDNPLYQSQIVRPEQDYRERQRLEHQ